MPFFGLFANGFFGKSGRACPNLDIKGLVPKSVPPVTPVAGVGVLGPLKPGKLLFPEPMLALSGGVLGPLRLIAEPVLGFDDVEEELDDGW